MENSSAEIVGSMEEILTELFLRIPLKPLVQLKLVSKHWNTLISDPKLHSSRKTVGFIFHSTGTLERESFYLLSLDRSSTECPPSISQVNITNQEFNEMGYTIFHSLNGLLLGYFRKSNYTRDGEEINDYFVYNPTTCGYKSIPSPSSKTLFHHWMYLVFDPSNSPHYNIVCVECTRHFFEPIQFEFTVYSSKTRLWKKYDSRFCSRFINFRKGVYWNRSIHWISSSETEKSFYFSPDDHYDNENVVDDGGRRLSVSVMPTPPTLGDDSMNYFGEWCDHLHFISYYRRDEYKFKVYEMRRDYSEWFVKYSVDVSNIWSRVWNTRLGRFGYPSSFAVWGLVRGKKGDDNDSFLVLLIKGRMVVYNVVTETFEIFSEFDADDESNVNFFVLGILSNV